MSLNESILSSVYNYLILLYINNFNIIDYIISIILSKIY